MAFSAWNPYLDTSFLRETPFGGAGNALQAGMSIGDTLRRGRDRRQWQGFQGDLTTEEGAKEAARMAMQQGDLQGAMAIYENFKRMQPSGQEWRPFPGSSSLYNPSTRETYETGIELQEKGGHGAIAGQLYFDPQGNPILGSRDPANPTAQRLRMGDAFAPVAGESFTTVDTESGILPFGKRGTVRPPIQAPGAPGPAKSPRVAEMEIERSDKRNKAESSLIEYEVEMDSMVQTANDLLNDPDLKGVTGAWQGVRKTFSPQKWADINAKLSKLKANTAFNKLQDMRNNSPTGGALGSVAVEELRLLGNSRAPLDQEQSAEQIMHSLRAIAHFGKGSKKRARAAFERTYKPQKAQADTPPADTLKNFFNQYKK